MKTGRIQLSEQHFKSINSELFVVDRQGKILFANSAFCTRLGLHRAAGRRFLDLLERSGRMRARRSLEDALKGEDQIEEYTFFNGAVSVMKLIRIGSDETTDLVAGLSFVSSPAVHAKAVEGAQDTPSPDAAALVYKGLSLERLRLEHRLRRAQLKHKEALKASNTDHPTGLKNRAGLDRDLQKEVVQAGAECANLFLVYIDLDDFKFINDTYGHHVGDRLLRAIGRRLRAPGNVVSAARVGGDEFAVLARSEEKDPEAFTELARQVWSRVFDAIRIDGLSLNLTGSAGVSAFGADAFDLETLKRNADAALIEAKRSGKNQVRLFDAALEQKRARRKALEQGLRHAVSKETLEPFYQPIVPGKSDLGIGVEVLARWQDEHLGDVPPDEFIRVATDCGLLSDLDLLVARKACRELKPLVESGQVSFVTFNVSPMVLSRDDHVDRFIEAVRCCGLSLENICIEITESDIFPDFEQAKATIATLKRAGIKLALDDYGTGYSNLRALLDLPVDGIKIDRSLMTGVANDERAMRVVRSIIHLARVCNAWLVAEGVETAAQVAVAQAMGCHYVQGYALSKPLAFADLETWLVRQAESQKKGEPSQGSKQAISLA
ncbi:sensor domain-containing protein [Henriciella aquimarina]|uniref:sensor domain-containing protein n=1 Tax=Henriciella aquimarina TaxID=545261 RepID=UPI001301ECF2|nr:sensor domain-containing phosphodiesterase [Henriciella aquimarina]